MKNAVDTFLRSTFLTLPQMYSTIGRTAARAIETKVIADAMPDWIAELIAQKNTPNKVTFTMHPAGTGVALNEAPRGALGHWLNYSDTKIDNYQMVVPSTWNFGPRDDANMAGPVEQALVGTPVVNDQQPLEVLRVIHSFDPCIACAVHLVNLTGDDEVDINVL
jgi:[NiFe] hydrogenase large subunit